MTDRTKYKRQYSIDNKEKLNEQARKWHKSNPQYSLFLSARNRAARFKRANRLKCDASLDELESLVKYMKITLDKAPE